MRPLPVPSLLRRFNLQPKKSLGQNFLVDEAALAKVAGAAELTPADTVLEIGPGVGSLTRHLAAAAQRVVAVELDQSLWPALEFVLEPYPNVTVFHGDILHIDLAALELPAGYKVVANIPYYITSAVIRRLLEAPAPPALIVLTVQREVAERICAGPGEMSLLAVSVQVYSQPRLVARVPAGAFFPRPEVESAVVRLDARPAPAAAGLDMDRFFRVVKAGFSQKRKQVKNALAASLPAEPAAVEAALTAAGVDPQRRAETLSLEEWGAIAQNFVGPIS